MQLTNKHLKKAPQHESLGFFFFWKKKRSLKACIRKKTGTENTKTKLKERRTKDKLYKF